MTSARLMKHLVSAIISVENAAANVGLHLNAVKTYTIVHNQDPAVYNDSK